MTTTPTEPRVAVQPAIHRMSSTVRAPSTTLAGPDGEVAGAGAQGFYLGDRRLLSTYTWNVGGRPLEVLRTELTTPRRFVTNAVLRDGTEPTPDPRIVVVRTREQHGQGFADIFEITSFDDRARPVEVRLLVAGDLASTSAIKDGDDGAGLVRPTVRAHGVSLAADGYTVHVEATPVPTVEIDATGASMAWIVEVGPRSTSSIRVDVTASQPVEGGFRPRSPSPDTGLGLALTVESSDARISSFVAWAIAELDGLLLADPDAPTDTFVAAGSPWYLTLFGRDSLWAARMMLPFGTELALSTLRVLARRQGLSFDAQTAEAPGRILHELRSDELEMAAVQLPAHYFGSIDATPLWMCTLVDAWRWGAPADQVRDLIPALAKAARWLVSGADADGDGLCEYEAESERGLSNQGWKDSADSINWQHGPLAQAPIALSEVQGYAYEAARGAADLLDSFDAAHPHTALVSDLRAFATRLRTAFHASFWLTDECGPYVAIGLDGAKQAVTGLSSNPGHLIGTGLLDREQEQLVADRMVHDLSCAGGLRTLASTSARFNPMSYHNGSVWPHDTAICARGMVLSGFVHEAGILLGGVLRAVGVFGPRLPELYGVLADDTIVAYPASCRPQAWAAASAGVLAWALAPVVPEGAELRALGPVDLGGPATVSGVRLGDRLYAVSVGADGGLTVSPID